MDRSDAAAWVRDVDEQSARLVSDGRSRADSLVRCADERPPTPRADRTWRDAPEVGRPPTSDGGTVGSVNLQELQDVIERTYGERDRRRGVAPTVAWLTEELGELAQAVRKGSRADLEHEFGDVLAWVATLANQVDVDLTTVVDRYRDGCPKCRSIPCAC